MTEKDHLEQTVRKQLERKQEEEEEPMDCFMRDKRNTVDIPAIAMGPVDALKDDIRKSFEQ